MASIRKRVRSCVPAVAAATIAGCSCGSQSGTADAPVAFDAAPKTVSVEWTRTVEYDRNPTLRRAATLPTGVLLVSQPELTLHAFDGSELGRSPWPERVPGVFYSEGGLPVVRTSGSVAVLFLDGLGPKMLVNDYSGEDLSLSLSTEIVPSGGILFASMAEADGDLFVAVLRAVGDGTADLELFQLDDAGGATSMTILSSLEFGLLPGRGLQVAPATLAFCTMRETRPSEFSADLLRIDTKTGQSSSLPLDTQPGSASVCALVAIGDALYALWTIRDSVTDSRLRVARISADGTALLAGPVSGSPLFGTGQQSFVYDGESIVTIGESSSPRIQIQRTDPETLTSRSPCDVPVPEGAQLVGFGVDVAGNDQATLVAVASTFGLSRDVVLMKVKLKE